MRSRYNSKAAEWNRQRDLKQNKEINTLDVNQLAVFNEIQKLNPKFAKHIVQGNDLLNTFIFKELGNLEILDRPMCTHCESPAAYDMDGSVYCFKCHGRSYPKDYPHGKIMTLRGYMLEELMSKGLNADQLTQLNVISKGEENESGIIIASK